MKYIFTEIDRQVVKEIQNGIPLCSEPFKLIAEKVGISEEELLDKLRDFKEKGIIRRFGARIKHHKAGYKENIMAVWNVPPERLDETGNIIIKYREVSHCYERPVLPDFPYNLYSMIHGIKKGDCMRVIKAISEETGIFDYEILETESEYKKTSPVYFID